MPEFQDRILKCVDCSADFVFTAGEQHFFHDKNFKNEPKRCKACKTKRQGSSGPGFTKTETIRNAPNAAGRPRFRSNRRRDARCTAGNAS